MRPIARNLMVIILGAGSGLTASFVGSRWFNAPDPTANAFEIRHAESNDERAKWQLEQQARRLKRLESQLLERKEPQIQTQSEPSSDPREQSRPPALDPQAEHSRSMQLWDQHLAQHASEPKDVAWARSAEPLFEADIDRMSDTEGFALDRVDCRTTTCAAEITWPDFETAAIGYQKLLMQRYQTNCATEATLPEPAAGQEASPYKMTVLYYCAESRAGG